jgi:hypothetical protein
MGRVKAERSGEKQTACQLDPDAGFDRNLLKLKELDSPSLRLTTKDSIGVLSPDHQWKWQ